MNDIQFRSFECYRGILMGSSHAEDVDEDDEGDHCDDNHEAALEGLCRWRSP
jgi:hypothetical protein